VLAEEVVDLAEHHERRREAAIVLELLEARDRERDLQPALRRSAGVAREMPEQAERVGLTRPVAGLLERASRRLRLLARLLELADVPERLRTPVRVLGGGRAGDATLEQREV